MGRIFALLFECFSILGPLAPIIASLFVVVLVMLAFRVWSFVLDLIPFVR